MYGIMSEELIFLEIQIGLVNSVSQITSFEVILPLKLNYESPIG